MVPSSATIAPQEHVKNLERCAVAGDIPGMALCIEQLHARWDSLDSAMQTDIQKLEAIFLSLVQLKTGVRK
jgi:hypothetical protein